MLLPRLSLIAFVCFGSQAWAAAGIGVSPGAVTLGGQPFTLTVSLTGTNPPALKPTFAVRWNGSVRPTTVAAGAGQLNAAIPASDIAVPGFAEITVVDQATGVVYQAAAWVLITPDVYAADLAYDSVRNRFYVSVPSGSSRPGAPAESVVAVDASSGAVLASVNVGSDPTLMAISDDASYLYVCVSTSTSISRIALSSFTQDLQINLPSPGFVSSMQVLPGSPRTLAVAHQSTGSIGTGGLMIFDDATVRASVAPGAPSRFVFINPQTIAGSTYLGSIGGYGIQLWKVSSSGVTASSVLPGATGNPVGYADGWLLTDGGQLIDPTGARTNQQVDLAGVGAFVPGQNRFLIYSPGSGGSNPVLGAYEDVSMTALGRIGTTQGYGVDITQPTRMLVWGSDGVAFVFGSQLFFGHTELAAAEPGVTAAGIVNSATLITGSISPGEIVSIFGSNLGTVQGRTLEFSEPRQVSTDLAETQVWFDGLPGTMLYAGSGQINAVVPFELAGKTTTRVQVWYLGIPSAIVPVSVSAASPGFFTQDGSGRNASAALNPDGSLNTPGRPAPAGGIVSIFGTGGGQTLPALADGQQDIYAWQLAANAQVLLNGSAVPVIYAGSAPDLVAGVIQINFQIPANFPPTAAANVQFSIGGVVSPSGVTIATH